MVEPNCPLIVAVDDEPDDVFFLRRAVERTGVPHAFQTFSNGEAAIVALEAIAGGERPETLPLICFLDIKMVGMSGFDLLRWIRTRRTLDALPVIMYSSSDDQADVELARGLGAQGYVKKYPSVAAMRTVLEEARAFALTAPPKKTFVQWSYRFIDAADAVAAK